MRRHARLSVAAIALATAALAPAPACAIHSSSGGLQDLAAFPKYEVQFLNELPLAASDAARCRAEGILADDDFLDLHPPSRSKARPRASIDGRSRDTAAAAASENDSKTERSDDSDNGGTAQATASSPTPLELVSLYYTPPGQDAAHSYLCALPSQNVTDEQTARRSEARGEPEPDPDPVASWGALAHLDGQCLYARHSWFTYAYCHNKDIRQFREARHTAPAPPEGYTPKEDPMFDAYTLGQAHPGKRSKGALPPGQRRSGGGGGGAVAGAGGGAIAAAQQRQQGRAGHAHGHDDNLAPETTATFGTGAASRYLVQRWTDGTRCDKTGRPREVEVQVHCSMTSGDAIYMVKEIETCKYVMVIHSPHLCSLPGFRPQTADDVVPAPIRCREVVDDAEFERWQQDPAVEVYEQLLRLPDKAAKAAAAAAAAAAKTNEKAAQQQLQQLPDGVDAETANRVTQILRKAFAGGGGDGTDGEATFGAADDAGASDLTLDDIADLFVVSFEQDEDGQMHPIDVDAVVPQKGNDRRVFLKRLREIISQELEHGGEEEEVVRLRGVDTDGVEGEEADEGDYIHVYQRDQELEHHDEL